MPGVYLRLLYCLFDLANTQRGQVNDLLLSQNALNDCRSAY